VRRVPVSAQSPVCVLKGEYSEYPCRRKPLLIARALALVIDASAFASAQLGATADAAGVHICAGTRWLTPCPHLQRD
jgi:hypothetical protein